MNDTQKISYWPVFDHKIETTYWDTRNTTLENILVVNRAPTENYRAHNRSKYRQQKVNYGHLFFNESTSVPIDIRERIAEDIAAVRGLYNANPDARNWPSFGFIPVSEITVPCISATATYQMANLQQPRSITATSISDNVSYEFPVYARGIRQELDLPQNMVAMLQKTSQNVFGILQNVD